MEESVVKSHVKKWLENQAGVEEILTEQALISGGLVTDLMAKNHAGKIVYIVECKGSVDIGELAKGIGQVSQYEYQKQMSPIATTAKVLFACPEDVVPELNLLMIPDNITVYIVSKSGTLYARTRHPISKSVEMELQLPRTFYISDVELNHLERIIQLIHKMGRANPEGLRAEKIQSKIGKAYPDIAAEGYNHLITLRSLGLLDDRNLLTPKGHEVNNLIETSRESFLSEMCECFYPFIANVLNAIVVIAYENSYPLSDIRCSAKEIADKICQIWGNKVRYLYDPRTVGTVLRILEELGAIKRESGKIQLKKLIHSSFLPWGIRQAKIA